MKINKKHVKRKIIYCLFILMKTMLARGQVICPPLCVDDKPYGR
jgi:hypothetical protein